VPYTGATSNVDLGSRFLTASVLDVGQPGDAGYIRFQTGGSTVFPDQTGIAVIGTTGIGFNFGGATSRQFIFQASGLTINSARTYTMPDATGTLALTSDITSAISGTTNYVPKFTSANAIGNSLIFDNGTNVGIGTTSPAAKLDVVGKFRVTDDIILAQTNGRIDYDNGVTGALRFYSTSTSTERMRITSTGNVGIGTTSPSFKLDVVGNIRGTGSGIFPNIELSLDDNSFGVLGRFSTAYMRIDRGSGNNIGILSFYTGNSATPTERMRITSAGNVGINTTSPTSKLHVTGLPEYATNAVAITGGLTVGAFYHTAGILKVVI
jgi:hypothetical protein